MPNFIEDTRIDVNNLHRELAKQAELYAKWAELHAKATQDRDALKLRIDIHKARLDRDIRTYYTRFGFDKAPTEKAIESHINRDEELTKLLEQFNTITMDINILQSAKQALEHKRAALSDLVKLQLAGYYSTLTTSDENELAHTVISTELHKNARIR